MKNLYLTTLILTSMIGLETLAAEPNSAPGLLPEIKMQGDDPEADDKKALETELMIRRSERLAISKLQTIVARRKGQPDEAHLLYRLAELHMRRAKTGRFFDLNKDSKVIKLAPPDAKSETAKESINSAIQIYNKISKSFPKFSEMDEIYFHNAFAHQQLRRNSVARSLYQDLLSKFPSSPFTADSHLALGEMHYEDQSFKNAWSHFQKVQAQPESRLYSYALYKGAWALYNLHRSDDAMDSLEKLVKLSEEQSKKQLHNLRTEALRDLVIFYVDNRESPLAYSYFAQLATVEELGQVIFTLSTLYQSHSRETDAISLLNEFDRNQNYHADRPKINLRLVELHEALKHRDKALAQIEALQLLCAQKSDWSSRQPASNEPNTICKTELGQLNLKLATKWWDLWKKNPHAPQFADWSEKAFELYLKSPAAEKQAKVRFSYAELLFQRAKYSEASVEYEKSARLEEQGDLTEKATYAAVVSLEKSVSDKWDTASEKRLYALSQFYLQRFPNSEQVEQVKLKLAYVSYVGGRMSESKGYLKELASNGKDPVIRVKAEDLFLDVLNVEKDYSGLRAWAAAAAGRTNDTPRKSKLEEISREARMAEIEIIAKGQPIVAAQAYEDFYRKNQDNKLAKPAFINAIRLYNEGGQLVEAAALAMEFAKVHPKDEKSVTLLQEAARLFEQTARPFEAAGALELLAERSKDKDSNNWKEIAADYYSIENKKDRAIELYFELAQTANSAKKATLFSKVYHLARKGSSAHTKAQKELVALRVEPYWSEIRLAEAQAQFDARDYSSAFQSAMKLVGQSKDENLRSQARLLQAEILKREFLAQSVKTSLDRLTIVLSLKTEKLDKAQSAYLAVTNMAVAPSVHKKALDGLREIYAAYVNEIRSMPAPRGLASTDEETMLRSELTALTNPIEEKLKETDEQIKSVQSQLLVGGDKGGQQLRGYTASQSVTPLTYQETYELQSYVPFAGGKL